MYRTHRLFAAAAAAMAFAVAGCGGGSQGTVPSAGGSSLQSVTQRSSTQSATVSQSFSASTLDDHHRRHDDGHHSHIVSLLRLDVSHGNASWSAQGSCDCSHDGWGDHHNWPKGFVFTPKTNETLSVPAFSLEDPCHDNDHGRGHGHDRDHRQCDLDNFYVVMVTIPNFSTTDVDGPGQRSNDDIKFQAANALALTAGQSYGFVLVRDDASSASPTPAPPTPTPCAGKSCPTPTPVPTSTPAPTPTPTPTPVPSPTPTPCLGKSCPPSP